MRHMLTEQRYKGNEGNGDTNGGGDDDGDAENG